MLPASRKIAVAHIGARRHYAVPVLLHRAGLLDRMYTDLYAGKGLLGQLRRVWPRALQGAGIRRAFGRIASLPSGKVTAFTRLGVEYARRLRAARTTRDQTQSYLWVGRAFSRAVLAHGLGDADTVYGFNGASEALFEHCREQGIPTILDQTNVPTSVAAQLLAEEHARWPEWSCAQPDPLSTEIAETERREARLATLVVCPSTAVASALQAQGIGPEKLRIVPFGIDVSRYRVPDRRARSAGGPLRVLTVGEVSFRKGIPYLCRAAAQLGKRVSVRVVGAVNLAPQALRPYADTVTFCGAVPHAQIDEHYAWADVFCLPSLFEGSAAVTYEALACGLPVVTTSSAGSVVRDGVDGFVVPMRDADVLASRLEQLASDPSLVAEMSAHARERAAQFDWAHYGERLVGALATVPADGTHSDVSCEERGG